MFVQVCWKEHSALPAPGLDPGAPFSGRMSFQLAGPRSVQFQQTENLFKFKEKYTFSNMPCKTFVAREIFLHL